MGNTRTEKVSAEHGGEDCPGPASQENVREMYPELFGGKPCEGEASETVVCSRAECPVCPEEKSSFCGTYVQIMASICDNEWFTDENGRYSCQKSCGMCNF